MLESIKARERLHWPEVEMSKKSLLNNAGEPVTTSQVYLERFSSNVLKDLFTTGTSSYNVLLQVEERERHSPNCSPRKRLRTVVKSPSTIHKKKRLPCTAPLCARPPAGSTPSKSMLSGSPTRLVRNISVYGSSMGLCTRPGPRPTKLSTSPSTKLPQLPRSAAARKVENSKKLCLLTAIKPSNVEREKSKFYKSEFTYNPQFEYRNPVSQSVLAKHSTASDRFLTQAVRIMDLTLKRYGNYETFEQATGGALLSRHRIGQNVKKYMEKEGCMGEVVVHVTDDLLSRASMAVVNGRHTLAINVSAAREHWLEGILQHEIGTHYFRSINNGHQPWSSSGGRKKHNLKPLNPTEEGLASIHSVLFRKDPKLWRAALLYYTVYQAGRLSFAKLFHSLGRFVQDPNTRWDYCVRAKRGQTNTAQPGCFSKDQVYLEGVLMILRYRNEIDFPMLMAQGKVSFEDVDRLQDLAKMDNVRIPHFMQNQMGYAQQLEKIMAVNQLTDRELRVIV